MACRISRALVGHLQSHPADLVAATLHLLPASQSFSFSMWYLHNDVCLPCFLMKCGIKSHIFFMETEKFRSSVSSLPLLFIQPQSSRMVESRNPFLYRAVSFLFLGSLTSSDFSRMPESLLSTCRLHILHSQQGIHCTW